MLFSELVKPGNTVPEIVTTSETGKSIKLSEIMSPNLLLVFWSSRCRHCRETLPELHTFYKKFKKKNQLKVLAISLDTDKNNFKAFISKHSFQWINAVETDSFKGIVNGEGGYIDYRRQE